MSKPEDNGGAPEEAAFEQLEGAISQLLERLEHATNRAQIAEARSSELGELVQKFTGDEEEAGRLMTRLKTLEEENTDLRGRLERGRAGVERMIARIRFLESQG